MRLLAMSIFLFAMVVLAAKSSCAAAARRRASTRSLIVELVFFFWCSSACVTSTSCFFRDSMRFSFDTMVCCAPLRLSESSAFSASTRAIASCVTSSFCSASDARSSAVVSALRMSRICLRPVSFSFRPRSSRASCERTSSCSEATRAACSRTSARQEAASSSQRICSRHTCRRHSSCSAESAASLDRKPSTSACSASWSSSCRLSFAITSALCVLLFFRRSISASLPSMFRSSLPTVSRRSPAVLSSAAHRRVSSS